MFAARIDQPKLTTQMRRGEGIPQPIFHRSLAVASVFSVLLGCLMLLLLPGRLLRLRLEKYPLKETPTCRSWLRVSASKCPVATTGTSLKIRRIATLRVSTPRMLREQTPLEVNREKPRIRSSGTDTGVELRWSGIVADHAEGFTQTSSECMDANPDTLFGVEPQRSLVDAESEGRLLGSGIHVPAARHQPRPWGDSFGGRFFQRPTIVGYPQHRQQSYSHGYF